MITITRRLLISAPKESVRLYLRDLANMAGYKKRVAKVESVAYPDQDSGMVEVDGRFLGMTWRGAFRVEFSRDGGYRSEMVRGPLSRMAGTFHLRPVSGGTMLTHEERYQLPWPTRLILRPLHGWIGRSMDAELRAVKEGAERLHRRLQLQQIESSL